MYTLKRVVASFYISVCGKPGHHCYILGKCDLTTICSSLYTLGQMVQLTILSVHAQKEGIQQKSLFPSNDRILSVMTVYQLLNTCYR